MLCVCDSQTTKYTNNLFHIYKNDCNATPIVKICDIDLKEIILGQQNKIKSVNKMYFNYSRLINIQILVNNK